MTRKDYKVIAEILNHLKLLNVFHSERTENNPAFEIERLVLERVAHTFADVLGAKNANFDHAKFLKAAGV